MVENQYIYLSLHVDDFLCVGTEAHCQSTKVVLEKQFKLKSTWIFLDMTLDIDMD
jgi:hypothetical protein